MVFRNRNKKFNRLVIMGMMLLVIAGGARLSLQHHGFFSEDLTDGIIGLLYGLAIGCLLLGLWRNTRRTGIV